MQRGNVDCVVIGYNDMPFEKYEQLLQKYGARSEAYRDLRFNFINVDGSKLLYTDLFNKALRDTLSSSSLPEEIEFRSGDIPNLAAAYLTHFLRRKFNASYINLFQNEKEKLWQLLDQKPLCVAITTTFYVLNAPVIEIVDLIRAHAPSVKIVVGGPLVMNHFKKHQSDRQMVALGNAKPDGFLAALEDMKADIYVVESQGEHTLSRIVDCLKNDGNLDAIPNIVHRTNGKLQLTQLQPENNSLDENYIDWTTLSDHPLGATLQSRTARSCAFKCSFCGYPARAGNLTLASMETIEKELDSVIKLGNVRNFVFIDDTFNVPMTRFKDICRLLIDRRYNLNWFSYFRCGHADEEAIELAARSGCKGVFLGIESGSNAILKNMNKAATVDKYRWGIEMLRKYNILTFASFIAGFPGETRETFQESVDFIRQAHPDYYRILLWYCEPGTPIQNQKEHFGITGSGFRWSHNTMKSSDAMDLIEEAFMAIEESEWLPQWSFDFWIIPYFLGRGVSLETFRQIIIQANRLLRLEFLPIPPEEKRLVQITCLRRSANLMSDYAVACGGVKLS